MPIRAQSSWQRTACCGRAVLPALLYAQAFAGPCIAASYILKRERCHSAEVAALAASTPLRARDSLTRQGLQPSDALADGRNRTVSDPACLATAPGADGGKARAAGASVPAPPGSPASPEDFNRVVQEARARAPVCVRSCSSGQGGRGVAASLLAAWRALGHVEPGSRCLLELPGRAAREAHTPWRGWPSHRSAVRSGATSAPYARQCYETLATSDSEGEGSGTLASVRRWFSGARRPSECARHAAGRAGCACRVAARPGVCDGRVCMVEAACEQT